MANLYDSVLNKIPSGIKNKIVAATSGAYDVLVQAIPELKTYYNDGLKKYNTLLSIMASIPQCVSDENFDTYLSNDAYIYLENDDAVSMAYNDIHDWIDEFGNADHFVQLSDSEGNVYNLGYDSEWSIVSRSSDQADHFIFCESGYGYNFFQTITDVNGNYHSFWAVISDIVESSALNELLYHACDICANTTQKVSDFTAVISSYANTSFDSVKECLKNLCSAFASAGIYGVVQYIVDFFRKAASLSVTDDGLIEFTDNNTLVPQIYLAGIIKTVGLVASSLVTAVLAAVNPILSGVGVVLTTIINTIFGSVSYDYEHSTLAQVEPTANTILSPMALCQSSGTITMLSSWDENLKQLLTSGIPFKIQVPGGELIVSVGKGSSSYPTRYEFHPDLIDRRQSLSNIIRQCANENWALPSGASNYIYDITWEDRLTVVDFLNNCTDVEPQSIVNQSSGVLSEDDDWLMRKIICCNIYLFLLYRNSIYSNDYTNLRIRCAETPGVLGNTSLANPSADWSDGDAARGMGWIAATACCLINHSTTYDALYKSGCTWKRILDAVNYIAKSTLSPIGSGLSISSNIGASTLFQNVIGHGYYYGSVDMVAYQLTYCHRIPKYDRASLWLSVALVGAATILATVVIVSVSVASVKAIREHRTKLAMNAERTWGQYVANPNSTTAKNYQKAVLKNNWYVKVFGGTSFSRSGFWSSTEANTDAPANKIFSKLNSMVTETNINSANSVRTDVISLDTIYEVITGHSVTPSETNR